MKTDSTASPKGRVRKALARHGFKGSLRVMFSRIVGRFYLKEAHRWYQLDLQGRRPRLDLPQGFRLVQASKRELPLLGSLPTVKLDEGQRRLGDGARLWLLMEGDRAAFACWTFQRRMPVGAASEALSLPPGAAALEDSVTAPDYRGHGLGGYALSSICDQLVDDGYRVLLTKIAEDNQHSRKAAERAGFQDVAVMHTKKTVAGKRVAVDSKGTGVGAHLAEHLSS